MASNQYTQAYETIRDYYHTMMSSAEREEKMGAYPMDPLHDGSHMSAVVHHTKTRYRRRQMERILVGAKNAQAPGVGRREKRDHVVALLPVRDPRAQ